MSFVSQNISKASTDKTESFSFNLGTTFKMISRKLFIIFTILLGLNLPAMAENPTILILSIY